ncbi:MAG: hypothetical protein K6T29_09655, partial [Peptococcaceae bacterium]|nr:hypothetical protein [Peptococcaceae bacterium]
MKDLFTTLSGAQASGWFREHVLQILEMPLAELEQNPRWLRLLGLFVEMPGMLEDKLRLFATVADLSPRYLEIRLERCPERDEVVRLLGERGQAKSRIMRLMVNLLDEEVPYVKGCEINDEPLAPICKRCRDKLAKEGDSLEIDWLPRWERYGEKLATPDITVADLIGDIDPIKVAEGRYLSDELTIH